MSSLLGNGASFRSYLLDYYFWQNQSFKTRKQFKNTLRVMYGRKKDRGHIKKKFKLMMETEKKNSMQLIEAVFNHVPMLRDMFDNLDERYY